MKRIKILALVLALCMAFSACGGGQASSSAGTNGGAPQGGGEEKAQVDYDLTVFSSVNMVYAQLANIYDNAQSSVGKTIRMRGVFMVDETNPEKVYFFAGVPDETMCCQEIMEFIWAGEHAYPQDYPKVDSEIEIEGTFDILVEGQYRYFYILADSVKAV